ncbi:PAS domain-containing protein [Candidatus Woesearchaeota archaeon]|nr:PAS domain-containing protein [Candidatus Woesearchaeota archaeon]
MFEAEMKKTQEAILKKAKEYIKNPQYITDLFDMSIVWCSKELAAMAEYSVEELLEKRVPDLLDNGMTDLQKREYALESIPQGKGESTTTMISKSGKKYNVTFRFIHVMYEGGSYEVGELMKADPM